MSYPRRAPSDVRPRLTLAALAFLATGTSFAAAGQADDGQAVYQRHCARCHQTDGSGVPGLYPSLRGLGTSAEDRADAIRGLLAGRVGRIDVGDATLFNRMPTHGHLGNETLAAALSHALISFSSAAEAVTTEQVAEQRLRLLQAHPQPTDPVSGASPLAELDATQYVTSAGPPITVDEFERARRLYYGHCTGCHGVLREGVAGSPLTPEIMRERGTGYLQSVIGFGASAGMPAWGTTAELPAEDIAAIARFLQHPVPQPPDLDPFQIRDTWHLRRPTGERPSTPRHGHDLDRMFVATLHDVGQIALFDGADKSLITRVEVGRAPHRVAASASGRYLYVVGRDGTLSLVDLYASPPERVATVRVGYEARTVAASAHPDYVDRFVLAGAYWPPQLVLLDGRTLEPLRVVSTRGYGSHGERYHPEPRVSDISASPSHPEFISHVKETGQTLLFPYTSEPNGLVQIQQLETSPELRAGSLSADRRFYLTPTDTNTVSVLDVGARRIVAEVPARVFGGNPGTSYVHDRFGQVWVTSTMVDRDLMVLGMEPQDQPEGEWRLLATVPGPGSGSLFVASHPASDHLWMDTPLNAALRHSQSVAVFDRDHLDEGHRSLPVARFSGLADGPRRVIQPTYSVDGSEVWLLVWNPQDRESAVVVVEDSSLQPIAAIRAPGLVTATRLYSVGALRREVSGGGDAARGASLYQIHCATCHGVYGEGDGPMAPALSNRLQDLRYLAQRNDGLFPTMFVREIIDGRRTRAAHGPADMPVWGAELARPADAEAAVAGVESLVRFLESAQIRNGGNDPQQ